MKLELLNELLVVKRGESIPSFSLGSVVSLSRTLSSFSWSLSGLGRKEGTRKKETQGRRKNLEKKQKRWAEKKNGRKREFVQKFESPALILVCRFAF
jgi:hypothetical protein